VPAAEDIIEFSEQAGFRNEHVQMLNPYYARTLETWAENLEAHHDEAISIQSEEVYNRYMRYLTGCAENFRRGILEVGQFTLTKS
jgi:cyclopropane-fatty-acyl-phospholipid synthase